MTIIHPKIFKEILETAYPLAISLLPYPLFAIVTLSVITTYFSCDTSVFILAHAVLSIALRCCENLLSGTRILTAQKIHAPVHARREILSTALVTGLGLAIILGLIAIGFFFISFFLTENSLSQRLSIAVLCLTAGLPGFVIYDACSYYLHAHKKTQALPLISWTVGIVENSIVFLYGNTLDPSFYICLLLLSFSRNILGALAYFSIPKLLKEGKIFKQLPTFQSIFYITKFGVSDSVCTLLFMGSYFVFSLLLEIFTPHALATFQVQINLLSIFVIISVSVISSGGVAFAHIPKAEFSKRRDVISQTFILSAFFIATLWGILFFFQEKIIFLMGKREVSSSLFRETFLLVLSIYICDLTQRIFIQFMAYNNDYLIPPLLRVSVFASLSLPLAVYTVYGCEKSLAGLLVSILVSTSVSGCFIFRRFYQYHRTQCG